MKNKFLRKKLACTYYFTISKEGAHMYKAGQGAWPILQQWVKPRPETRYPPSVNAGNYILAAFDTQSSGSQNALAWCNFHTPWKVPLLSKPKLFALIHKPYVFLVAHNHRHRVSQFFFVFSFLVLVHSPDASLGSQTNNNILLFYPWFYHPLFVTLHEEVHVNPIFPHFEIHIIHVQLKSIHWSNQLVGRFFFNEKLH